MSVLGAILMVIAGIGAVVGMRLSKSGMAQGRFIAGGCALLAVVLAVVGLSSKKDSNPALVTSLNRYSYAAGHNLGRHLAENYNGSRALVLVEPTWPGEEPDILQAGIEEGLRQGMGSDLELVDVVPVDPPPGYIEKVRASLVAGKVSLPAGVSEDWIPVLERGHGRWFSSNYLATLLASHKGTFDVLISAVGVPRDFANSPLVRSADLPKAIAVLNPLEMPMAGLVGSGVVDALVVLKPSLNPWQDANEAPQDIDEAFEKRFVLVTKDNVKAMAEAYPDVPNLR